MEIKSQIKAIVWKVVKEVNDNEYDMVICAHVLEHVEKPLELLKEISQKNVNQLN